MWKILMFEISAKKGLCDVIWGSEVKTSDLATHFSRNSGASNRGKWGKADYLRKSMQYFFTECLNLTKIFYRVD